MTDFSHVPDTTPAVPLLDQVENIRREINSLEARLFTLRAEVEKSALVSLYDSLLELWHAHKCHTNTEFFLPNSIRDDFGQLIDLIGTHQGKNFHQIRADMYPEQAPLVKECDPELERLLMEEEEIEAHTQHMRLYGYQADCSLCVRDRNAAASQDISLGAYWDEKFKRH